MSTHRLTRRLGVAVTALALVGLAACGGGASASSGGGDGGGSALCRYWFSVVNNSEMARRIVTQYIHHNIINLSLQLCHELCRVVGAMLNIAEFLLPDTCKFATLQ